MVRNPASQITSETQSNDSYSWDGHVNLARSYATNGLNQYTSADSASFTYDGIREASQGQGVEVVQESGDFGCGCISIKSDVRP